MIKTKGLLLLMASVLWLFPPSAASAAEVDWSRVDTKNFPLFYPGLASWEYLLSEDHRLGGRNIKLGKKSCRRCHLSKKGVMDLKAQEIAEGKIKMKRSQRPFENDPIPGKKGVMSAAIQVAYDAEYIYIRLVWASKGTGWRSPAEDNSTPPDRVSLQVNKTREAFRRYGCFIACHSDVNTMPFSPAKKKVTEHPYYAALKRDDVRLYAYYTRDKWWAAIKSEEELEKLRQGGGLIDLWTVEIKGGKGTPGDGWILEDRQWEKRSDVEGSTTWSGGKKEKAPSPKSREYANKTQTYTTLIKRRLKTNDPLDVELNENDTFTVHIAIHEDGTSKRKHYVSFPMTVGLGVKADIKAQKVTAR